MSSLLCAHVLESSASALDFTVRSKAPAVKLVNAFALAAEYRKARPNLLILARNVLDKDDRWRDFIFNPTTYYAAHVALHLNHPANKDIDAWETGVNEDGPRKIDGTDQLDIGDMAARGQFESVIAEAIGKAGKRPIVGNFAVGNPSGTPAEQLQAWRAYAPALRAAQKYRGFVGIHVYFDVSGWELTVNSLVQVLNELGLTLEILITECGLALGSQGVDGAWYAARSIQFDAQVREQYSRVRAATIFTFGGPSGWRHFDVDNWPQFLEPVIEHGATLITNQDVLNVIGAVGRESGRNLFAQMPHDVLQAMIAKRRGRYIGGDPFAWGLTAGEKLDIKQRAGL